MFFFCSSRGVSTTPPLLQVPSPVDASELVYLTTHCTTLCLPRLFFCYIHRHLLLQDLFDVPTPSLPAAFNISANSPFIPDAAALILHDQFCHWSSPADNVSMISNPSLFLLMLLLLLHLHFLLEDCLRHWLLLLPLSRRLLLEPLLNESLSAPASPPWLRVLSER